LRLYVRRNKKNSMPKNSKTLKTKTTIPKKKSPAPKAKATVKKTVVKKLVKQAPVRSSVTKKTGIKKTKAQSPVKFNKVAIDVISDDEIFSDTSEAKSVNEIFSTWPDFGKKKENEPKETEDIYEEKPKSKFRSDEELETYLKEKDIELGGGEEYDKQKKFFSDWATHIAPADGQEKPAVAPKKSLGLYRRQAFFYIGATLVLLLAVFYLFFARLTVLITPQGETVNDSLSFNISSADASSTPLSSTSTPAVSTIKTIDGKVQVIEVSADKSYTASSGEILGSEVVGNVTLYNKYNKAQPLVVNTRLLSADGKLFRLKESVNIPAGGSIEASVYADKPSADMAVTTLTRFTIPGLWAGLQDRIYAENSGDLVYQTQVNQKITQSDIDQAKKDINVVLDLKAKNDLASSVPDTISVYGDTDQPATVTVDSKVGDVKPSFTLTAKKKVVVVTFSKTKAAALAQARLSLLVPDDKQLLDFNQNNITYSLDGFDLSTNIATVKAFFNGTMSLKTDSSLIDSNKLRGLNKRQISEYLDSFPEIKDYQLKFTPPFITTAPVLPDLIKIKIQS